MSGTKAGVSKRIKTIKAKYGKNAMKEWGRKGGKARVPTKGFGYKK